MSKIVKQIYETIARNKKLEPRNYFRANQYFKERLCRLCPAVPVSTRFPLFPCAEGEFVLFGATVRH